MTERKTIDDLLEDLYSKDYTIDTKNEKYDKLLGNSLSGALFFQDISRVLMAILVRREILTTADDAKLEHLYRLCRQSELEEREFILKLTQLGVQQKTIFRLLGMDSSEIPLSRRIGGKPTAKMIEAKKIIQESIREELEFRGDI